MKQRLVFALRFLLLLLGNLLADIVQIESLLGAVATIAGLIVAIGNGNPQVIRIGGLVTSAVSVLAVALPKLLAAGRQGQTDLQLLLGWLNEPQPTVVVNHVTTGTSNSGFPPPAPAPAPGTVPHG